MNNLFIFGAGFTGQAIGRRLKALAKPPFHATTRPLCYGTTRDERNFSALHSVGITPLLFDGKNLTQNICEALARTSHLIIAMPPDESGDPFLKGENFSILKKLMPQLQWIGYLSTVGVYGDAQGKWIDETAPCVPTHARSRQRLDVERQWQNFADFAVLPLCIMRLAGIYGPGRNVFIKLRTGRAHRIIKENQFFNRIHCDDIAASLLHLGAGNVHGIFNIADDEPAPPQDIVSYAAKLMGLEPPPAIAFEQAELSDMARSFYADNRLVSNKKLRDSGYQLIYPNYRQALKAMWLQND